MWCRFQAGNFSPKSSQKTPYNSVLLQLLHYFSDVIMSAMVFQITGVSIVCSAVCSGAHKKHQSSASAGLCEGNLPMTGEFPTQKASKAEIVSMMTSSNGNIFRVTGPLCGEFTGHRWIPHTKASDAELWCFFFNCAWINGWVNNR